MCIRDSTGSIGRFDQSETSVVAVGHQRLLGPPGFVEGDGGMEALVVDGNQVALFVTQAQGAPGAVVQAADVAMDVAQDGQAVVVAVAEGAQVAVAKVQEWSVFAGLGDDQFVRLGAQVDRCAGQAVVDRRTLGAGQWKGCLLYTSPSPRDRQKSRMPSSA